MNVALEAAKHVSPLFPRLNGAKHIFRDLCKSCWYLNTSCLTGKKRFQLGGSVPNNLTVLVYHISHQTDDYQEISRDAVRAPDAINS